MYCVLLFHRQKNKKEYQRTLTDYKKAYEILLDYWEFIPECEHAEINRKLEEAGV
jgi:hypothetical protein